MLLPLTKIEKNFVTGNKAPEEEEKEPGMSAFMNIMTKEVDVPEEVEEVEEVKDAAPKRKRATK